MNKKKAEEIGRMLREHLEKWGLEHGLDIAYKGGRFDQYHLAPRIEIRLASAEGDLVGARAEWEANCCTYDLLPEDFGKEVDFRHGGGIKKARIVGIEYRRRKFPILVKDAEGQEYTVGVKAVLRATGRLTPELAERWA